MPSAEEIEQIVREIRERVRARYPSDATGDALRITLPDLLPLVHARDAAEAKVAAIGTVNPRPGGPLNAIVQFTKRAVARALDWHVREQVEFNRQVMASVEATLEALNETKRALAAVAGPAAELRDVRSHWEQWRVEWERKLFANESQFLRSVADLQGAFQHRQTLMEASFRDIVRAQHADYLGALERSTAEAQQRFWSEVEKARREFERLIHEELRIVRQRSVAAPRLPTPETPSVPGPQQNLSPRLTTAVSPSASAAPRST